MILLYEPLNPSSGRLSQASAGAMRLSRQKHHANTGIARLWGAKPDSVQSCEAR